MEIPQLATIIVTSCYFSFYSAPSSPPSNVVFTQRSKNQLTISWTAPPRDSWNGQRITYQVCSSYNARSRNPTCFSENIQSSPAVIKNLRPGTKYFVTVAAGTSAGYGPKSAEVSEITRDGGKTPIYIYISIQLNNLKMTGRYFYPTTNIYIK